MKFFIDTADVDAIRELNDLGMVDGVTTNPSLILKSGRNILEVTQGDLLLRQRPRLGRGRGPESRRHDRRGPQAGRHRPNIAVKVPLTWDGLKTCKTLAR